MSHPQKENHDPLFKGVWIPAAIWEDDRLTLFQKALWSLIDSLSKKNQPCFATNRWLAMRSRSTLGNVSNEIAKLKKMKLIVDVGTPLNRLLVAAMTTEDGESIAQGTPPVATVAPLQLQRIPKDSPNMVEKKEENKQRVKEAMASIRSALNVTFKRKDNAPWTYAEERLLYDIAKRPDALEELSEIIAVLKNPGGHCVSTNLRTTMEYWNENLDKARNPRIGTPQKNEPINRNSGTHNEQRDNKWGEFAKRQQAERMARARNVPGSSPDKP